MLAWLLTAQVLTAGGPALHVDLSKDRTLSCKANALLEKAVRARLPRVRVASSGKPKGDDLIAAVQRVGGSDWRFAVTRADGTVAVSRELQAMPCPQLAELSALILERYLSGIAWAGKEGRTEGRREERNEENANELPERSRGPVPSLPPPPVDPPPIPPDPEPPPPPPAPIVPAPVPSPPRRPSPSLGELTLSVGGGGWISVPFETTGSLAISLGLRVVQRFHASLLFFSGASSLRGVTLNNLPRGSLGLQTHGGFGTFSVCTERFVLCGGLLAGARITTATALGPSTGPRVFNATTTTAVLPEVGGYGRLSLPLYGRLGLAADLAIAAPLGASQFQVAGISSSIVTTPAVDFLGSVALSLRMF